MSPDEVHKVSAYWREHDAKVQEQGYHDALNTGTKQNPYGQSQPEHNHWTYGAMLGHQERQRQRRAHASG